MSALYVLLLIGATIRLTRLLTTDAIFESPRSWTERRVPAKVAYLLRCDWCMSIWVGFAVFTLGWYAPDTAGWVVSGALTSSLAAGWSTLLSQAVEARMWEHDGRDDDMKGQG